MRARSGPFEPGVAGTRTVSRKQASRRSGSMCHLYVGDKVGVWPANQHTCFNQPRLGRDGKPATGGWRPSHKLDLALAGRAGGACWWANWPRTLGGG